MAVWQRFESIVLKAETEHLSGSAEAKKAKVSVYARDLDNNGTLIVAAETLQRLSLSILSD